MIVYSAVLRTSHKPLNTEINIGIMEKDLNWASFYFQMIFPVDPWKGKEKAILEVKVVLLEPVFIS